MGKLSYYIIHCLDTPPRLHITIDDLKSWHMGPKDLDSGGVEYLGNIYPSREDLPPDEIGGLSIKRIHGNGWDRLGYSLMIHMDGEIEIVTPYNDDEYIDDNERTWGVSGINGISRHIALEGGIGAKKDDDFFKNFSDEQYLSLSTYLKTELYKHPGVKIAGHNDFTDKKACPGFQVKGLLDLYGLKKYTYHG